MVGAFQQELMEISIAVPEAAPAALGAWGTEEGGLGLDDPHAEDFIEEKVPASPAGCQWRTTAPAWELRR